MVLALTEPAPEEQRTVTTASKVLNAILNQEGAISPTELARAVGCSRSTVHHHRTGYTEPSPTQLKAYAEALGIPPALFFEHHIDALRWLMDNKSSYFSCSD